MLWSVMCEANMFLRICLVSLKGILEYLFVMSREANRDVDVIGVCFSSQVSSEGFLTLNVYGSKADSLILVVSSWERLCTCAFSSWHWGESVGLAWNTPHLSIPPAHPFHLIHNHAQFTRRVHTPHTAYDLDFIILASPDNCQTSRYQRDHVGWYELWEHYTA